MICMRDTARVTVTTACAVLSQLSATAAQGEAQQGVIALWRWARSRALLPIRDRFLCSHHVEWCYWLSCLTAWGAGLWCNMGCPTWAVPVPSQPGPARAAPAAPGAPTHTHRQASVTGLDTSMLAPWCMAHAIPEVEMAFS